MEWENLPSHGDGRRLCPRRQDILQPIGNCLRHYRHQVEWASFLWAAVRINEVVWGERSKWPLTSETPCDARSILANRPNMAWSRRSTRRISKRKPATPISKATRLRT